MKKYLGLLFMVFISCQSDLSITGLATNCKEGASIRNKDGVFIIDGKDIWEDSLNNRNVQAKIIIKSEIEVLKSDLIDEKNNSFKQGRIGTTFISELKEIKIIK